MYNAYKLLENILLIPNRYVYVLYPILCPKYSIHTLLEPKNKIWQKNLFFSVDLLAWFYYFLGSISPKFIISFHFFTGQTISDEEKHWQKFCFHIIWLTKYCWALSLPQRLTNTDTILLLLDMNPHKLSHWKKCMHIQKIPLYAPIRENIISIHCTRPPLLSSDLFPLLLQKRPQA
jgi:hypothetical protein